MQKEFHAVFQITKLIMFEVNYYTLGSNRTPYFSTSANKFSKSKFTYTHAGQAQKELLPKGSIAEEFYKKWDPWHLKVLTDEQLEDLFKDLEPLKEKYNFLYKQQDSDGTDFPGYNYYSVRELSMQPLKK